MAQSGVEAAIRELEQESKRIRDIISSLRRIRPQAAAAGGSRLSAAARRRISLANKKRCAPLQFESHQEFHTRFSDRGNSSKSPMKARTHYAKEVPGALPRRLRSRWKVSRGGWAIPEVITVDLSEAIDCLDLSTRAAKVLTQLGIKSVGQLLDYPKGNLSHGKKLGPKSIAESETKVGEYLQGRRYAELGLLPRTHRGARPSLPGTKAFVCRMLSFLPERDRDVLADRYGFWNGQIKTLKEIGDAVGLTRERVRQIQEINLIRLRRMIGTPRVKSFLDAKVSSSGATKFRDGGQVRSKGRVVASLADDCTLNEASLALSFLRDIGCFRKQLLLRQL
jgi:hypothetical protein